MTKKQIVLANPRGFCAGVHRAIATVEKAIEMYGSPVFVRHEIVHNKRVVDDLKEKGAIFVQELSEIPDDAVAIFSAHGVSEAIEKEAKTRGLTTIDATCPLVSKVHKQAKKYEAEGYTIVLIGHDGHPEVEGTKGRIKKAYIVSSAEDVYSLNKGEIGYKVAYITQTTLSMDDTKDVVEALKETFPNVKGSSDICYATQSRQNAVKELAKQVDILLVVGSKNSSNSNRLRDLGDKMKIPSYLVDDVSQLKTAYFDEKKSIGITAGASAPAILVEEIIAYLNEKFNVENIKTIEGIEENIKFKLPIIDKKSS